MKTEDPPALQPLNSPRESTRDGAQKVSRNTAWMLGSFLFRLGVQAVYFIIIARALGVEQYGAFTGVVALAALLAPFASLGTGNLLIKHVARDPDSFAVRWGICLRVTLKSGFVLTVVAAATALLLLPRSIPLSLIVLVCIADLLAARLLDVSGQAFQAVGRMGYTASFQVLIGIVRLVGALALVSFGFLDSAKIWAACYMVSSAIAASVAIYLVVRRLGAPNFEGRFTEPKEGSYFAISLAAQNAYNDIDKTMLVGLATLGAAGIYGAAYRLIEVAFAPVRALVYATYSTFFSRGEDGIEGSAAYARRLLLPASAYGVVVGSFIYVLAPVVPHILGSSFKEAVPALRWLAILPLLKSLHYFGQDALTGANMQGVRTAIQSAVAIFNVAINFWLIPAYGWRGAAWSSIASDGLLAASIWIAIRFMIARPTPVVAEGVRA